MNISLLRQIAEPFALYMCTRVTIMICSNYNDKVMDYKTNVLNVKLTADENLLLEIDGLRFAAYINDRVLFDYTAYFENTGIKPIDYKVFMRTCKHFIENFAKETGLKTSELFYQDKSGHIFVASEIVLIFLAFANPELLVYFNNLVGDAVSDGVAYSNGFAYKVAAQRLPDGVLKDIIQKRKEENEETTEQK